MSQEKLQELYNLKMAIETKEFQKYVMTPLFSELDKLKDAYDCKTLVELSEMKGKTWGLKKMIGILKQVETDIRNLKYEIEQSDK
jgi:hypothetical protein